MKKIVVVLFFLLLICSRYEFVDMSQYESKTKSIEVKGAIKAPGVYEVDAHASVKEILQKAQGCLDNADTSSINMSQDLPNESVLVIPEYKEVALISINSASEEELDSLPGIGPAIAKRIVEYRKVTPFQSIEEIKEVKGIGDAMYAKIQNMICL